MGGPANICKSPKFRERGQLPRVSTFPPRTSRTASAPHCSTLSLARCRSPGIAAPLSSRTTSEPTSCAFSGLAPYAEGWLVFILDVSLLCGVIFVKISTCVGQFYCLFGMPRLHYRDNTRWYFGSDGRTPPTRRLCIWLGNSASCLATATLKNQESCMIAALCRQAVPHCIVTFSFISLQLRFLTKKWNGST